MTTTDERKRPKERVLDLDTHFWQPYSLWEKYVDPAYRDAIGKTQNVAPRAGLSAVSQMVATAQAEKRADDPEARLKWMDGEGIDGCVIFPGASGVMLIRDAEVAAAACSASNRWCAEHASAAPGRLFPSALLPLPTRYTDAALAELEAVQRLGMKSIFFAPASAELRWSDPALDPIWRAMEAGGIVANFHEFARLPDVGIHTVARESYTSAYPMMYLCGHVVEMQLALMDLIIGGVFERFPKLMFAFAEAHVAWLPGWLALMDNQWEAPENKYRWFHTYGGEGTGAAELSMTPSEYFKRQAVIAIFPDDTWVDETIAALGDGVVGISSDWPHPNGRMNILDKFDVHMADMPAARRRKILSGNAARIFGL